MKRYLIEDVKCGIADGGMGCGPVSDALMLAIKYRVDNVSQWINVVDTDGIIDAFLTDEDIFEKLMDEDFEDKEFYKYLEGRHIDDIDGVKIGGTFETVYESTYENSENPAAKLIRYLLFLFDNDEDDVDESIKMGIGKFSDELDIPITKHEKFMAYNGYEVPGLTLDQEALYKMRLSLETDIATPSVFHDLDGEALRTEKAQLNVIMGSCTDEAEYQSWKEDYLAKEFEKLSGKKFLTIDYLFAGIGQYDAVIPEEDKESFMCWISSNGSAFLANERESTEDEIKRYIAIIAGADEDQDQ